MKGKRKLFDSCVLPALLYGAETWVFTDTQLKRLAVAQRRMERRMINVTLLDRVSNERLRQITKVKDVVEEAKKKKGNWMKKIEEMAASRWARRLTEWQPREDAHRGRGRPRRRWRDDKL